jgi:hypothetical protein
VLAWNTQDSEFHPQHCKKKKISMERAPVIEMPNQEFWKPLLPKGQTG